MYTSAHATAPIGPIVVIDVETTQDRVVSLAALRLAPDEDPGWLSTYVNPGPAAWSMGSGRRCAIERRIHQITPDMTRGQPTMREVWPVVRHLADGATIVAYGAAHERRILIGEISRWGGRLDRPQLCALGLARRLCVGRDSYALSDVAYDLGLPIAGAHTAAWDVAATAVILSALLATHQHRADLPEILRACTLPAQRVDTTV